MERNLLQCCVRCCTGRCGSRGTPMRGRLHGCEAWLWTWGEDLAPALNKPMGERTGGAFQHARFAVGCCVCVAVLASICTGLQACCPDGQQLLLSRHFPSRRCSGAHGVLLLQP